MSKKTIVLLVLLIVSPVVIWFLWPSDEAIIRKLIGKTALAAEKGDVEAVMRAVDLNYSDSYGLSYLFLKKILETEFKRLQNIEVTYTGLRIEVFKDGTAQASMDLEVLATRDEQRGYFLGGPGNKLVLKVLFSKNQIGQWRVTHAEYDLRGREPAEF